jgi:hypothetical protein
MKLLFITFSLFLSASAGHFSKNVHAVPRAEQTLRLKDSLNNGRLFDSDEVLNIILQGDISELLNDRSENMKMHPVSISYIDADGSTLFLRVNMKTRGHFRRLSQNCSYPPLSIQFIKNDTLSSSIFREQDNIKLVMPCNGDEYVVREWLVYKVYNLVTPKSFRARLVKVQLLDSKSKKETSPFYGMLIEEENQMAQRNRLKPMDIKIIPEKASTETFLDMAVFQYLIGNTDWSVQYLQNIKLMGLDSQALMYTVPYDFDHAGIVGAPYAKPAPELDLLSVNERRYRGYCIKDFKKFDTVIAHYKSLKKAIYDLYANSPLINDKYKKKVFKYLDDFYAILDNKNRCQKEFTYPCNKNGTGNVVIKGLKDQ